MNRLFTATALLVCLSQAHGLLPAALHSAGPSGVAVFNGTLTLIARNPEGQLIESGSVTINDARFLYPGLLSRLQPTHMPLYGSRFGGNSLDAYNAPSMSFHGQRLRRSVQDGPDDIPSLRSELDSMYKLQNTLQNFKQELSAFESSESSSDESTSGQNRQKRQAEDGGDDDGSSPTSSIAKKFKGVVDRTLDVTQKEMNVARQKLDSFKSA